MFKNKTKTLNSENSLIMAKLNTVNLIFGFKVSYLRQKRGLSFQQLREKTGMSLSYLHDIEKGKKYPKTDKIMALAKALGVDYDYLVSLHGSKKLQPVIDLFNSDFIKVFPMEMFGLSLTQLLELFINAPDKTTAFVNTIIKIIRNYHLRGEDFYKAALRSFQDLNDNYFEDIEQAVQTFKKELQFTSQNIPTTKVLTNILKERFDISVDRTILPKKKELQEIRSYFVKKDRQLLLNDNLSSAQENFLIAKEIGFQYLKIKKRPYETRMLDMNSFDKLLNNFYASYFSVAFLMDEREIIKDIKNIASWIKWDSEAYLSLLDKYDVTPEMLQQRLINIFPKHFGIKDIFFLRMYGGADLRTYNMTKEVHLSQLHHLHANRLSEHYCRRWVSINLIRRMKAMYSPKQTDKIVADAQISLHWKTKEEYLSLCMAKPDKENPKESISVTIGLLITDELRRLLRFLNDPELRRANVNNTCERCEIADCMARAAPPIEIERENEKEEVKELLRGLKKGGKLR